jgi:hypothetical protein
MYQEGVSRQQFMRRHGRTRGLSFQAGTVLLLLAALAGGLDGQAEGAPAKKIAFGVAPLPVIGSDSLDFWRLGHLLARRPTTGFMLRSPSSLAMPLPYNARIRIAMLPPEMVSVSNSAIPYSINDGTLWAGRGVSRRTIFGLRLEAGPLRVIAAPEITASENAFVPRRDTVVFSSPAIPFGRRMGGFVFPWYTLDQYRFDMPMRMGNIQHRRRTEPGQSTAMLSFQHFAFGVSTENQWWGPGIRNAIVLSNNAAGFPHLFFRTNAPVETRIGTVEARLFAGGLRESDYFDTNPDNDLRSISAFGVSFVPRGMPDLTLGVWRSVYATATNWNEVPNRILWAFTTTPRWRYALGDTAATPGGREQIYALSARWVFPDDGFEVYTEWARTQWPTSLRDLLAAPNHSQGYTLGLQWARQAFQRSGIVRIQAEVNTTEQSSTFQSRPLGIFYHSRRVVQGYSLKGQPIGTASGPGSSNQWFAADYLSTPRWRFSAFVGRIRWNEDIQSMYPWPVYQGYCIHDVTSFFGGRAGIYTRYVYLSSEMTWGNRMNAYFQEQSGCPNGTSRVDIRNRTISFTLGTLAGRR